MAIGNIDPNDPNIQPAPPPVQPAPIAPPPAPPIVPPAQPAQPAQPNPIIQNNQQALPNQGGQNSMRSAAVAAAIAVLATLLFVAVIYIIFAKNSPQYSQPNPDAAGIAGLQEKVNGQGKTLDEIAKKINENTNATPPQPKIYTGAELLQLWPTLTPDEQVKHLAQFRAYCQAMKKTCYPCQIAGGGSGGTQHSHAATTNGGNNYNNNNYNYPPATARVVYSQPAQEPIAGPTSSGGAVQPAATAVIQRNDIVNQNNIRYEEDVLKTPKMPKKPRR